MRAIGLALLALTACTREAPEQAQHSYRREGAPIASAALLDSARIAGRWYQTGHFPGACAGAQMQVTPRSEGLLVSQNCAGKTQSAVWVQTAVGRFETPSGEVWVLWVDQGYRTLVLGRPSGDWGAIWNRAPQIPADRLTAAREILDFNGYDAPQLEGN